MQHENPTEQLDNQNTRNPNHNTHRTRSLFNSTKPTKAKKSYINEIWMIEMTETEKKGIERAKVGPVVSAILVAILAISNIWLYIEYDDYVATHSHTNTEFSNLNDKYWDVYANYTVENWWHHYYKNQSAAELKKIGVSCQDVRPWYGTPHVRVTGYIVNVGNEIAYNCEVEVRLYRHDLIVTTQIITLGDIHGQDWWCDRYIDKNIYYDGPSITWVTVTPSWDTEP
jgi:hypothetical protein